MKITEQIKQLIDKYGLNGRAYGVDTSVEVKCFVQPMRYKNKIYLDSQYTKLGIIDETCFLYIGPPDAELREGTDKALVLTDGRNFTCSKVETIYYGSKPAYKWAILRLRR